MDAALWGGKYHMFERIPRTTKKRRPANCRTDRATTRPGSCRTSRSRPEPFCEIANELSAD
jgi:hypothetical protein